jgi:hypothetical protein
VLKDFPARSDLKTTGFLVGAHVHEHAVGLVVVIGLVVATGLVVVAP